MDEAPSASAARRSPAPAIVSTSSSLSAPPPAPAAASSSAVHPSPPPLGTITEEGAPHKRAVELLRKRYRLPASLILSAIPQQYLSACEESEGKLTGLVSCAEDAEKLILRCEAMESSELRLYCAQFLSLRCADSMDTALASVQLKANVQFLNPCVVKEKFRLASMLRTHHDMLHGMALKVQGEANPQELIELRCRLAHEHEKHTCILEVLLQMKMDAVDRLLLLLMDPSAASADLAEAFWILEHHRPSDHSVAVHPEDGTISWSAVENIRQSIKERLGNRLPNDDTLVRVRAYVSGVFGRYHFESKLQPILENTRAAVQSYMIDPMSKAQVVQTMKAQAKALERLRNKRSLIGSYPIDLPGEPLDLDSAGGSHNGNARSDGSDRESSGSSNAYAESSISVNSIVSTDSELYDPDIFVMHIKDNEDGKVSSNAFAQAAAALSHADDVPAALSDADDVPTDEESDGVEEKPVEEDEFYVESGAIMQFPEIEGESEDARAIRFSNFCISLDYCL